VANIQGCKVARDIQECKEGLDKDLQVIQVIRPCKDSLQVIQECILACKANHLVIQECILVCKANRQVIQECKANHLDIQGCKVSLAIQECKDNRLDAQACKDNPQVVIQDNQAAIQGSLATQDQVIQANLVIQDQVIQECNNLDRVSMG